MGGKGRRRREKNYMDAHGGNNRLPPPPNAKEIEALPSKLRKIISLKNSFVAIQGDTGSSVVTKERKRKDEASNTKAHKPNLKESRSTVGNARRGDSINETVRNNLDEDKGANAQYSSTITRERKRKRKFAKDLRFESLDQLVKHSRRKEREKEYLKEKKKKHKKLKADDALEFLGRENIRFGEVVEAPPKLLLPKVPKICTTDASKERLRLQAVDSYRKRRGWDGRPGIKVPSFVKISTL